MGFNWVTASELDAWTEREPRRAQELLPKLVIKLILSLTNSIESFSFPSGKSIQFAGYDGILKCSEQTNFFPKGQSVWEFGTDKDIQGKFNEDIEKRTKKPLRIDKSETVFVFVTSRIWYHSISIAEKTAQARKDTDWKDIIIVDANYLEQWLEKCPSVSAWLANIIGKNIGNYTSIEDYWLDKTNTTIPILNQEFFLQGRDETVDNVLKWFRSTNNHLLLRADSVMEALLVLSAIMLNTDDTEHEQMLSSCLIVEDEGSWNNIISLADKKTVLIPDFNLSPNIKYPNSCRSILPINKYSPISKNNRNILCIDITKQRKKDFELAMEKVGFKPEEISLYEIKTKRSFFALYRQITTIPVRQIPKWAGNTEVSELIPALFVGSWNDRQDGDKALIEALSGCSFTEYIKKISKWLTIEDPPIIKIDNVYMIVSVADMWNVLWDRITPDAYQKLCSCIPAVFKVKDPTYELPEEQWFAADLYGKKYNYSTSLLEGLVITMIMLSERNDLSNLFSSISTKRDVDYIVKQILDNVTDWQEWYTIAKHLPLLVEASADAVLSKFEEKAKSLDNDFWMIFNQPKDEISGRSFYTHLLWALEHLVWEQEYAIRAITVLALFGEKKFEYKMSNSPINSLYHIFCLWHPQTCLSLEQRTQALEVIVKKYPYTGWQLLKNLLPNGHQVVSNISKPRWKDVDTQVNRSITNKDYWDATKEVINICLKYITPDVEQWKIIFSSIDAFFNRIDDLFAKCIEHCKLISPKENMIICDEIGQVIYRHREFPDAKWSMTEEKIAKLEKLYYEVLPKGALRYYHLFRYRPYDIKPKPVDVKNHNYEEEHNRLCERRRQAIIEIIYSYGMDEIYKLIENAEDTRDLGIIISREIFNKSIDWGTIFKIKQLNSNVASAIIIAIYYDKGLTYLEDSLSELHEDQIGYIMCCLPLVQEVWNLIEKFPNIVQSYYWENVSIYHLNTENRAIASYLVDNLLKYNRPYTLMDVLAYSDYNDAESIIKILIKGLEIYPEPEKRGMHLSHVPSYDIVNLFEKLYEDNEINEEQVARLELEYLPIFDYDYELKCLSKQLVKNPQMFVELMMLAYRKDNDDNLEITDDMSSRASRAYEILSRFRTIPGYSSEKRRVDQSIFNDWIKEVLRISQEMGYMTAFEICIGTLLSYSPVGEDGIWPHQCIRDFFEENFTESLLSHFVIGKSNQRGVHNVTGGDEEKLLAEEYTVYANKLMLEYPKMAAVVRKISDGYFEEARYEQLREMGDYY